MAGVDTFDVEEVSLVKGGRFIETTEGVITMFMNTDDPNTPEHVTTLFFARSGGTQVFTGGYHMEDTEFGGVPCVAMSKREGGEFLGYTGDFQANTKLSDDKTRIELDY